MFSTFLIAWLALAAVREALAAATESDSPIEEIRGELKAMKRDKNPELRGAETMPQIALPGFAQPEEAGPPPAATPPKSSAGAEQNTGSNWLLDGMELQAGDPQKKTGGADSAEEWKKGIPDLSDPGYFLKLYVAQLREKKEREENERRHGGGNPSSTASAGDAGAFGEFLDRWISPENMSLLGLDRSQATATGAEPAGLQKSANTRRAAGAPASNPFVEAMQPASPPARPPGAGAAGAPSVPSLRPEIPRPASSAATPSAETASPPAPGPPPSPADEKKYFPQLNRF